MKRKYHCFTHPKTKPPFCLNETKNGNVMKTLPFLLKLICGGQANYANTSFTLSAAS